MSKTIFVLFITSVLALAPAFAADDDAGTKHGAGEFCRKMFVRIFFSKYATIANKEASEFAVNHFEPISYDALNTHFFKVEDQIGMLQRAKDPHGLYMRDIGLVENATLSPSKIFEAVHARGKSRVERGEIAAENALEPGRFYQFKDGSKRPLKLGEFVPASAQVYPTLLDARDFWKMVAQGIYPLGGGDAIVTTAGRNVGNDFFHDLSHFSGFDRDLAYQASVRQVARTISEMSDEALAHNSQRLYFLSESLSAFPKESQPQLQKFIASVRGGDTKRVLNRREYAEFLERKSDSELRDLWSRASNELPKMQPLGGTASDKVLRVSDRVFEQVAPFEYSFEGGPKVAELSKNYKRSKMINALSSRLTMADAMRNTDSAQMVHDLATNRKDSPVMRLLCENQEMWTGAHMMSNICK